MSSPAITDKELQSQQAMARLVLEQRKIAEHPWYAISKGYIFTEDEKRGGETRSMPHDGEHGRYLKVLCDLFMEYPIAIMLKSRQMMASWLMCWLVLWTAMYQKGSLSILQGKRLDDVKAVGTKSLMGRLMFIYRNLPEFMKSAQMLDAERLSKHERKHDVSAKGAETLTSLVVPGGGVAVAAPQGPDVIRSKTATTVIMDELPHHPEGLEAWTAALPTVDGAEQRFSKARLWGVGTPNGRDPLCFEMADWDDWRNWDERTGFTYEDGTPVEGLRVYLKRREYDGYELSPICCIRLHYTAEYDPEAWARRRATRAAYPSEGAYEREHEISFRTVAGMAVYGTALTAAHLESYKPNPNRPIIISMDLGYQGTSACIWQEEIVYFHDYIFRRQHLFWHKLWKGRFLDEVLDELKPVTHAMGFNWKSARWIADFNSLNTHHGGAGVTDFQIYQRHGIIPEARQTGPNQVDQGVNLVRSALRKLPDGKPQLMIDRDHCPDVIAMFDGGYRYDEPTVGKGYVETPMKDGYYDHVADSVRYRFWVEPGVIFEEDSSKDLGIDEPRKGTAAYVRRYLSRKRSTASGRDTSTLGPTGAIGAD